MADQTVPKGVDPGELQIAMPRPPWVLGWLFAQFGRPAGFLGRLAGREMAKTDADDRIVVDRLEVQPDERVLEVGFGPGVAVELIGRRAGFVAGVDHSEEMQRQASRRNRAAVAAGRVELRVGTADRLPYPDGHFSKACAVHTVYFWPSVEAGLREIQRVLAPDGRLVVGVRMRRAGAGVLDPSRYGLTDGQLAALVATLEQVGFRDVASQRQAVARQTLATVTARR